MPGTAFTSASWMIDESWARLDALPPFWIYIKMAY
jgi:hypothetical protein